MDKSTKHCDHKLSISHPFAGLKLALESDDEQLAWLKQFERSGVATGESEEVLRHCHFGP